ncbi:MAG TPA: glycosyltransferase family 4 protein [Chromatiales bacterium]|nr:glycosyltransferase family 4 protein [Chromatiales bacterium]
MLVELLLPLFSLIIAWGLTSIFRRYAIVNSLLDLPNARSSHDLPTPRGGGLAIVITFLLVILGLGVIGYVHWRMVIVFAGAGGLIALIGFVDDHGHVAAYIRLVGHFFGVIWALVWLGDMPPLTVFDYTFESNWFVYLLVAIYLVWLLNLYNFMDGIDGIASIEAISVCLGAAFLTWLNVPDLISWLIPVLLATTVAGFLYWNFPPARVFMGDAGSGFLGIILGILSIQSLWVASQLFWAWLILLGVFIVDATVTLLRRVLQGEKFYQAHRSHAYQYASRKYNAHLPVTLAVLSINVMWLFPIAYLVAMKYIEGILGVLLAYFPLLMLALIFKAGVREEI